MFNAHSLGMQNIEGLFSPLLPMTRIIDKTQEIKYADEVDYIVEGLDNDEIDTSLELVVDLMGDERFKAYMRESRHLSEMVQVMLRKRISESARNVVLEILSQVFNPYSFGDLKDLFKILLMVLDGPVSNGTLIDSSACARSKARVIMEILERIPIKWYSKFSECVELERLVFFLQICMSNKVVRWNRFLLSFLVTYPEFELNEDFVSAVLKKGRSYEILVNYTALKANVGKLSLSPSFRQCLKRAVLEEFTESKRDKSLECMLKGRVPTPAVSLVLKHEKNVNLKGNRVQNLKRKTDLVIILINLLGRDFYLDISLGLIAKAYYSVDQVTRCYIAVLLLFSMQNLEKDAMKDVCIEDLKKDARHLLFDPMPRLSKEILDKLIEISG
uniref:Uncharacterized protein n=1 Tax=Encephalitozoon cuniculi TaxID=6035 RepID=M1K8Z9_ENCCN|nr:hypothetical protein ECU02_1510 [Encephalitozoon cuniculi]